MNEALQNLEIKVENGGTTPQGRLTSSEWNILVAAVKALDADSDDPSQLEAYLKPYAKTADVASTYATIASLSAVTSRLNDFLAGSDIDAIINKWSELETFLAGLTETDNLATILSGKANKATTLAGYGITDAYTKSHIDSNFVTIGTKQQITGEKDFVGGFKVNGGLVEYNATLKAWVFNGDLLVTGGMAAFSNISGFKPSTITDAVLIDDRTIKRNADGLLYAVSQGAGGINEDQLADYLTTNGYATQDWVTGKGYITSSALEPYALKTAIPTNTNQLTNGAGFITASAIPTSLKNPNALSWSGYSSGSYDGSVAQSITIPNNTNQLTNGAGFITGITSSMVTSALGYTPLSTGGGTITGEVTISCAAITPLKINSNATDSGIYFNHNGVAKTWVGFEASIGSVLYHSLGSHRLGINNDGVAFYDNNTLLHSGNYSNYALPITGGTVNGDILVTGAITCRDNFRTNDNYYGFSVKSQGSEDNWYGVKTYMQFDEGPTMGVCRIGTAFRYQGLVIGFSTGNDYNYNIPNEYSYTDVFLFGKNGDFLANGALRLGQNNRTCIMENPFAAYGMTLADGNNNNPLVTVSYFNDRAYVFNYKNSNENSGIVFYDDGRVEVHVAENFRIKSKNANLAGIDIGASDTDIWRISHRGSFSNNELHFYHNANGTWSKSVLSLSANGDVVTVNNLLATGGVTSQNSSDRRLKRNLRKFNASEVLMSLGGVWEYEYIDSEVEKNHIYEGTHYGLIYQNVKGTSLDAMCHERADGFGTLNYYHQKFISLIAGATMENVTEVEKLKRKIRHLENKVKQLEQRS